MSQNLNSGEDSRYTKYLPYIDRNYNMVMLLGLTLNTIERSLQAQARVSGLTAVEYEYLILVKELGDQAIPAELSRILLKTPPATTTLLNRMEKSGLVKRKAHPENKKIKIVVMTEKGQVALETALQHNVLPAIIGTLPEQKFRDLWNLLEELKDKAASVIDEFTASSP